MKSTRKSRLRPSGVVAALSVASLAVAGPLLAFGGGGGPVRIGVVAPLTGPSATVGQDIVRAARLAVAQINERGGLLGGRKAELLVADDACDAKRGSAEVSPKAAST